MDLPRTELPRWLSSASVAWLGALLALLAVLLAGGFVWHERADLREWHLRTTELYARTLEDQANRSFNTVDIALTTLADTVRRGDDTDLPALAPTLTQALQGLPFLRSLSVMDGTGRVRASSVPGNVGVVVDLARVPLPAAAATDRLGELVPGRDLAEAGVQARPAAPGAGARSFLPLVRAVADPLDRPPDQPPGAPLYLVAVLNLDHLANEQQRLLEGTGQAAALLTIDGRMMAATDGVRLAPGEAAAGLPVFRKFLPTHESGSYIGPGIDGGSVVAAFRTLRRRPIAVLVELNHDALQVDLNHTSLSVAGACAVALGVIAAMAGMAWRSLRSFEAVHAALAVTREQVMRSESDLRTLVDSVHELVFRADAQGRIGYINERWQQISGRDAATALGRRLSELCLPDDRALVDALFDPGATAERELVRVQDAAGELRTLEISVAAVHDAQGALSGHAGFAVDVTERQLARRKLQAQLDFTARLIEVSPTPLFVKDERGRFLTVNRAWLALMDLRREQVIGRDSAEIFGADGPMHNGHDQRAMQGERPLSYDNRLQRPGREPRDTVVTKLRFTQADGREAGIIGSIIDVTEFRAAERSTREARDAAERANRAKSEFIANISHELRTPLQSIIGFSELGEVLADENADFKEMFGDIHAGGRRMLTLVNGLLDVSRLDSSFGSLTLRRGDLHVLVAEVVKELRPLAAQRELQVDLAGPAQPVPADVDAFRIQQVVRNVLANALRFAPAGSRIELVLSDHGADGVELSVRDHGPGIPADELDSIFDAFVQSTRTRDGSGGTGLGLTICRKIMGAHGGRIVAANAPGGGALMRIGLPAAGPGAPAVVDAPVPLELPA